MHNQAVPRASAPALRPRFDRWSTVAVDPRHRLEYWREVISKAVVATSVSIANSDNFLGEITCRKFSGVTFNCFDSWSHEIVRAERHIRHDNDRHFLLSLQLAGQARIIQGGDTILLPPGSMGLVASGKPFSVELFGEVRRMVAVLPHALVERHLPSVWRRGALQIDPSHPVTDLIRDYVIRLCQPQSAIDGLAGDVMSEHLCSLLGIVVAAHMAGERTASSSRDIRKAALLTYLRRNAFDADLTPHRAASAVGISVRSLHDLMRDVGRSFSEWLIEARVAQALRLLQSLEGGHRKISDIAAGCGFSDLSHFNRVFKAQVGCTPRDARLK